MSQALARDVTRGPSGAEERRPRLLAADGPLVTGPLGPLVTPRARRGRVEWSEAAIETLERQLGASEVGGRFACPIPKHSGAGLIGSAPEDPDDDPRLLCCRGRWRSLGEVRAALAYGADALRSNIELATWTRRLAFELGAFAPLAVPMADLPRGAGEAAEAARHGFELLVGLRWADGEHRPVAWSVRFAAAWCDLTHREAHTATRALIEHGVIAEAGRAGLVRLYLPGAPVEAEGPWQMTPAGVRIVSRGEWEGRRCTRASHWGEEIMRADGGMVGCRICHPPAKGTRIVPVRPAQQASAAQGGTSGVTPHA